MIMTPPVEGIDVAPPTALLLLDLSILLLSEMRLAQLQPCHQPNGQLPSTMFVVRCCCCCALQDCVAITCCCCCCWLMMRKMLAWQRLCASLGQCFWCCWCCKHKLNVLCTSQLAALCRIIALGRCRFRVRLYQSRTRFWLGVYLTSDSPILERCRCRFSLFLWLAFKVVSVSDCLNITISVSFANF